jgi:hypothetical protein
MRVRRGARSFTAKLNKHLGKLGLAAGGTAFVASISAGDRANVQGLGNQIKVAIGSTINRVSGGYFNPLGTPSVQGWSFNWSKAFNGITWAGLAATAYGYIGPKLGLRLPLTGAAKKVGVPLLIGAFIGGALDPSPGGANPANMPGPARPLPMGYGGGTAGRGKYQ